MLPGFFWIFLQVLPVFADHVKRQEIPICSLTLNISEFLSDSKGNCLYYMRVPQTYLDAKYECWKYGLELATLESNFLDRKVRSYSFPINDIVWTEGTNQMDGICHVAWHGKHDQEKMDCFKKWNYFCSSNLTAAFLVLTPKTFKMSKESCKERGKNLTTPVDRRVWDGLISYLSKLRNQSNEDQWVSTIYPIWLGYSWVKENDTFWKLGNVKEEINEEDLAFHAMLPHSLTRRKYFTAIQWDNQFQVQLLSRSLRAYYLCGNLPYHFLSSMDSINDASSTQAMPYWVYAIPGGFILLGIFISATVVAKRSRQGKRDESNKLINNSDTPNKTKDIFFIPNQTPVPPGLDLFNRNPSKTSESSYMSLGKIASRPGPDIPTRPTMWDHPEPIVAYVSNLGQNPKPPLCPTFSNSSNWSGYEKPQTNPRAKYFFDRERQTSSHDYETIRKYRPGESGENGMEFTSGSENLQN